MWAVNAVSRLWPGYLLEARTEGGGLLGHLYSAPMRWDGDPGSLPGYEEVHGLLWRQLAAPVTGLLDGRGRADTLVLQAVLVDPAARGRGVSAALIREAQRRCARRGRRRIISPFRPSGYGRFKRETGRVHSEETFRAYCGLTDSSGAPVDPWLRSLARSGARFLKPELRSVRRPRSMEYFESFRRRFRPGEWVEVAAGVWECGEVATWVVEASRRRVWLLEPNLWGELPVRGDAG